MPAHRQSSRPWLREPAVHFAVLGALLLGVYGLLGAPAPENRIVVSDAVVQALRQDHLRRTGAPPTAAEEESLIRHFVENEILYREALSLGLDRSDIVVRRRLVQKMEFLLEGELTEAPSDGELEEYLHRHAERYRIPARISLTHVFVGRDRHGEGSDMVAAELLRRLQAGASPDRLGDGFLRGSDFTLQSRRELVGIFGPAFAEQVIALPPEIWSEPISSSYGLHLVRVTEKRAARVPKVEEIRDALLRDWEQERREQARLAALDRLRAGYDVRFETSAGVSMAEAAAR